MEHLVIKAMNGETEAFTELIKLIQNDLFRIAQARLKNIEDINDAIQETMITSYNSIKKLKNAQYFKTWIIRILINECNKVYNNNKRRINLFNKVTTDNKVIEIKNADIVDADNRLELEQVFDMLNYDERICIVLFYNSNYSLIEISNILDLNPNTVKSRITRAKQKIKKYYKGGVENEETRR